MECPRKHVLKNVKYQVGGEFGKYKRRTNDVSFVLVPKETITN